MSIELSLERRNNYVQGRYSFGPGVGTIEGTVEGNQLYFEWNWAGNYGRGIFKLRKDGYFTGTWGFVRLAQAQVPGAGCLHNVENLRGR